MIRFFFGLLLCLFGATAHAQTLPWQDDFQDDGLGGWTIHDDTYFGAPIRSGPGNWQVQNGILRQTSNIWVGDPPLEFEVYLGSHIVAGHPVWQDYALNVDVKSTDNDGIGVLFRYQDPLNYYRFLLMQDAGNGGPVTRLERRVNGNLQTLAEDRTRPAFPSDWFTMTADVRGDSIRVYVDGALIFAVRDMDNPVLQGTVGLSVYANDGAHFDNVEVTAERVIREAPLPAPPVERYPYLQRPTPTSMTIAWRTAAPAMGQVVFGSTEALGQQRTEAAPTTKHAVTLEGLQPNTSYFYQVFNDGEAFSEIIPFQTAKTRADTSFSLLVFGDSGTGTPAQEEVAAYIKDKAILDLGIHVGDVHQGQGDDYDPIYFQPYREVLARMPLMPSIGNHDTYFDNAATYLDDFYLFSNNPQQTERYYSFDYAHAHFIALDSNIDFTPGSAQYEWFVSDLQSDEAQSATWRFVYFHHPPYCQAWSGWAGDLNARQYLMPLFEQYGVDVVFNGHTHAYERGALRGVYYIISGGGGGGLDDYGRDVAHIDVTDLKHHITRVDVRGDKLHLQAITPDSEVIDDFTIDKNASSTAVEAETPASSFTLHAPYPNPSRQDAVTLTFQVAQPGSVRIEVYNTLGQKVELLTDSTYPAGMHTLQWTPAGASGLYFFHARNGTRNAVQSLLLQH